MKELSAAFSAPLSVPRPRGARLLEGFSPKLRRRVQLFDRASFAQWIRLEADPNVLSMFERPARMGPAPNAKLIDFWVLRANCDEFVALEATPPDQLPAVVDELPVHTIRRADLAAAAVWINNWQRMLPVINATRSLVPKHLLKTICHGVRQPKALGLLEHEFSIADPGVVRGAIFELLRVGQLVSPGLHIEPLSRHTLVEAAP